MMRISPGRSGFAIGLMVLGGASYGLGQTAAKPSAAVSTLPAAQPTAAANQTGIAPSPAPAPQHVEVSYNQGKLAVDATNASLNEILREVSQKTGIKIIGGVQDDRVFGHYGPSKPSTVLDALLQGTGSNVLLVDGKDGGSELILTARHGGVTPPNPNAGTQANDTEEGQGQYVPPIRPYQPPVPNGRTPGFVPNVEGVPPSATGDVNDPNSPKTPQQIYDQLQRTMQQQKQAPAQTAPPQ